MKKVIVLMLLMVMGYTVQVQGSLITIGTATYSGTGSLVDYNLIWDDDNNGNSVVWLDYTNGMETWADQKTWAAGLDGELTYNIDDTKYRVNWDTDWRLPTTVDGAFAYGTDGTTTGGYNITTSELGHLFYTELGNKGYYATDGTNTPLGWGLTKTGDFQNLTSSVYWPGTEYSANADLAWYFDFGGGYQGTGNKTNRGYGLAVRSGDVAVVPEPTTIALLGIGLAGIGVYGVRRRRQHR